MFLRYKFLRYIFFTLLLTSTLIRSENAFSVQMKNIVAFEGIRENVLVGYGLVVGLNGTGDNLRNSVFTEKGLVDFLEKLGINTRGANLKTRNIAAVMATATLPAFARAGSRMSVNISALGDAKSLRGGTLLATPLLGADGNVYAVAQGLVSIGTSTDSDINVSKAKIIPTAGFVNNGAIVERELDFVLNSLDTIKVALKTPDITTARTIATTINSAVGEEAATAEDPGTVSVAIPSEYQGNVLGLLADIENLDVTTDHVAKIVIDEATGTVVISENVTINPVAVSQGNLIVKVQDEEQSLLDILSNNKNKTPPVPGTSFAVLKDATNLNDLIKGLNALAVKTSDLVAILRAIQQAGALQATIEVK